MEETTRRMGYKMKRKDSVEGQRGKMNSASEKQTAIRAITKSIEPFFGAWLSSPTATSTNSPDSPFAIIHQ